MATVRKLLGKTEKKDRYSLTGEESERFNEGLKTSIRLNLEEPDLESTDQIARNTLGLSIEEILEDDYNREKYDHNEQAVISQLKLYSKELVEDVTGAAYSENHQYAEGIKHSDADAEYALENDLS